MVADDGAPAFTAGGDTAPTPSPTPTAPGIAAPTTPGGFKWIRLLPFAGIAAILVIAIAVLASLNLGGPATASDGSFSVKNPGGWHPTTFSFINGRRVVLALEARKNGGTSEFAVADYGEQIALQAIAANWDQVVASGQLQNLGRFGSLTSTTVGGAPALIVDIVGTQWSGQLVFVDYANTTYIVALVSTPGQFQQMRGSDFATILSSWQWLR
ncbi:MAG: hypothetical protein E6I84_04485 [Chloroflexi bacterium]|nr:MAG: hypothetical protein E6J32_00150 [Chloroflexota bacterium]TMD66920.1 MAG: hypothetical protein E6I84_04485 [Chloroflexota bacterium]